MDIDSTHNIRVSILSLTQSTAKPRLNICCEQTTPEDSDNSVRTL